MYGLMFFFILFQTSPRTLIVHSVFVIQHAIPTPWLAPMPRRTHVKTHTLILFSCLFTLVRQLNPSSHSISFLSLLIPTEKEEGKNEREWEDIHCSCLAQSHTCLFCTLVLAEWKITPKSRKCVRGSITSGQHISYLQLTHWLLSLLPRFFDTRLYIGL